MDFYVRQGLKSFSSVLIGFREIIVWNKRKAWSRENGHSVDFTCLFLAQRNNFQQRRDYKDVSSSSVFTENYVKFKFEI